MALKSMTIDSNGSSVSFKVKKLIFLNVGGAIDDLTGEISFDMDKLSESYFNVCINPATLQTDNIKRTEHLKSADFFAISEYPQICFQSTSVSAEADHYKVAGELTLRNTTRKSTIHFTYSSGLFKGEFTINRSDYKIGSKFPAFIISDLVHISINCKIKQP